MQNNKILVISGYLITDPPTQNVINCLSNNGFNVVYIEQSTELNHELVNSKVKIKKIYDFPFLKLPLLKQLAKTIYYSYKLNQLTKFEKPDVVIAITFYPIFLVDKKADIKYYAGILDIPALKFSGKFDKFVTKYAWLKLNRFDIVWASDAYKASLTKHFGSLLELPIVCHNCPPLNYFGNLTKTESQSWLRQKLIQEGLKITQDTQIILRAGAIGLYGGIEDTIEAMKILSHNFVFLMMGRPDNTFKIHLLNLIKKNKLTHRVYLLDRPNDIEWKKTLLASHIGHLIHIRPDNNSAGAATFDLNSSLSNNRLFQYMAASLPIISYKDERMEVLYNEVKCFQVVDTNNLQAQLVAAVSYLEQNKDEQLQQGINGYNAFLNTYNWEHQFEYIKSKICF